MSEYVLMVWPRWLTKQQARLYTGYSIRQLEYWMSGGVLPYSKPNGNRTIRFDIRDLDRLMERDKIKIEKGRERVIESLGGGIKKKM